MSVVGRLVAEAGISQETPGSTLGDRRQPLPGLSNGEPAYTRAQAQVSLCSLKILRSFRGFQVGSRADSNPLSPGQSHLHSRSRKSSQIKFSGTRAQSDHKRDKEKGHSGWEPAETAARPRPPRTIRHALGNKHAACVEAINTRLEDDGQERGVPQTKKTKTSWKFGMFEKKSGM